MLLPEEVGEIAAESKRTLSTNYDDFDQARSSDEIADTFTLLAALANEFGIDIVEAVEAKFFDNAARRNWKTEASS